MSPKQRHRRRRHSKRGRLGAVRSKLSLIAAHPWRSSLLALLGFFLCWVVLTKSLPYVLATSDPDLALALNPNNPKALVAKAEQTRKKLLSLMGIDGGAQAKKQEDGHPGTGGPAKEREHGSIANLPKAEPDAGANSASKGVREALRTQISQLATKAIANDPLNASAFRLLAEVTGDPVRSRSLMQEAVRRSRRETAAVFWLLNDSYYRKDFVAALDNAGILLQSKPDIASYIMNYLANICHDPKGRRLLAERLSEDPGWRGQFLGSLWDIMHKDPAALELIAELKQTKHPAEPGELSLFVSYLAWNNAPDVAYNLWLQELPASRLDKLDFLTNPGFEKETSGWKTVFDWAILPGVNAAAEFVPSGQTDQRLLHVSFGEGRIEFPVVRQVLVLPPGRYRLEGKLRGSIISKRGLRWQLTCLSGTPVLGETDMLMGDSEEWRAFALEAQVPQSKECVGQVLRLFHDSRSASEEYVTGEVWFGSLHLERLASANP